jgi:Pumilio-family RNA binding repeat
VSRPLFDQIKSKIFTLSNQKFSSNVIERCLENADPQTLGDIINDLCQSDKLSSILVSITFIGLIRNQYGNYVVQKALKISFENKPLFD